MPLRAAWLGLGTPVLRRPSAAVPGHALRATQACGAQVARSTPPLALQLTARGAFTHDIQMERRPHHQLVNQGVYRSACESHTGPQLLHPWAGKTLLFGARSKRAAAPRPK